jgi:hypothetical protein
MDYLDDAMGVLFPAVDHPPFDEILVYHLHRLLMVCLCFEGRRGKGVTTNLARTVQKQRFLVAMLKLYGHDHSLASCYIISRILVYVNQNLVSS